jgi:hypothetical protein
MKSHKQSNILNTNNKKRNIKKEMNVQKIKMNYSGELDVFLRMWANNGMKICRFLAPIENYYSERDIVYVTYKPLPLTPIIEFISF